MENKIQKIGEKKSQKLHFTPDFSVKVRNINFVQTWFEKKKKVISWLIK